jgi:translation elongation factor EF-Tu-like GTPase
MGEQEIGVVTRYFGKIGVAAIRITAGSLKVGDRVKIEGHSGESEEVVESIQVDRVAIDKATVGQEVGIKVQNPAHEKDLVYKITG